MDSPTMADALDDMRLLGTLDTLAAVTGQPWLCGERIEQTAESRDIQARASVDLLRIRLHVTDHDALVAVIIELHNVPEGMAHKLASPKCIGVGAAVTLEGKEIAKWVCADERREARALNRLWKASQEFLTRKDSNRTRRPPYCPPIDFRT
jgi:hypothetical protein